MAMILFCEECGKKNTLSLLPEDVLQKGFICQHCHAHTPPSALAGNLAERKEIPEQEPVITWAPNVITFGTVSPYERSIQKVIFQGADGTEYDIDAKIRTELKTDLVIRKIDARTMEIHLLPVRPGAHHTMRFQGEGMLFSDRLSTYQRYAQVSYTRQSPLLATLPDVIDLGVLAAGADHAHQLTVENNGNQAVLLQIKPDPRDFSFFARFAIQDTHVKTIASGRKATIPFVVCADDSAEDDCVFTQRVLLAVHENNILTTKNVIINALIRSRH